mgnify:CR=1 FL=1
MKPDVEVSAVDEGVFRWATKVQITDKVKNHKQYLNVDGIVEGIDKLRLEAQTSMGIQVASLVADNRNYSCQVYPQKAFYSSQAEAGSLKPLVKIDIHPLVLLRLLKGQRELGDGWTCQTLGEMALLSCKNKEGVTVTEIEKSPSLRKVRVESAKFELMWAITDPPASLKPNPLLFQLEKKESYKLIQL